MRSIHRTGMPGVIFLALCLIAPTAWSQRVPADPGERDRAVLLGKLRNTSITINTDGTPASDVVDALAVALDIPIIARWTKNRDPYGMSEQTPVTLSADRISGELALELVLEQCALIVPCTWQLRDGYVEIGTKERLSAPKASVRRMYDVEDLLHEAPYFGPTSKRSNSRFDHHPYKSASLKQDLVGSGPSEALLEILRGIFALVEPGNWDAETVEYIEYQSPDGRTRRIPRKIAHVQQFRRQLLMTAPDFIHRAVVTAGPVIDSPPLDPATCAARSAAATREGCTITVHPVVGRLPSEEELRQAHLRALIDTRISVDFVSAPAREAFAQFAHQVDAPFIGRYRDHQEGHGIDPDRPITLSMQDASALDVLNAMLDACSEDFAECTWQLRRGFVEFGTKSRLNLPAARELRIYEIADLIMHVPENAANEADRLRREVIALDLVQEVVEQIEPNQWDYGQPLEYAPPRVPQLIRDTVEGVDEDGDSDSHNPVNVPPISPTATDSLPKRYIVSPMPATIRYWRDVVMIRAPDYIHRQVGGYTEYESARR